MWSRVRRSFNRVKSLETVIGIVERLPWYERIMTVLYAIAVGFLAYLQDTPGAIVGLYVLGALILLVLGFQARESILYRRANRGFLLGPTGQPISKVDHPKRLFWIIATIIFFIAVVVVHYESSARPGQATRGSIVLYATAREGQGSKLVTIDTNTGSVTDIGVDFGGITVFGLACDDNKKNGVFT